MGKGNVYVSGGFAHSKRSSFTVESATYNTEVMALQNGTEVATGSQEITCYDVISAGGSAEAPTFNTKYKAVGTKNEEIGFVYILNADGTCGRQFKQVTVLAGNADEFTYDSSTKLITFAEGNAENNPTFTDKIVCAYTRKTADTAQRIELRTDTIPAVALVTAYGIAKDVCSGDLFPCVLEGRAQIDGNYTFELTADGDPVVQNVSMEFIRGCLEDKLNDFTVYTDDEAE